MDLASPIFQKPRQGHQVLQKAMRSRQWCNSTLNRRYQLIVYELSMGDAVRLPTVLSASPR